MTDLLGHGIDDHEKKDDDKRSDDDKKKDDDTGRDDDKKKDDDPQDDDFSPHTPPGHVPGHYYNSRTRTWVPW